MAAQDHRFGQPGVGLIGWAMVSMTHLLGATTHAPAGAFHVAVTGVDAEDRDGRSWDTAWNSLAYACDRVPGGEHVIRLGSGTFVATRTARPRSGVTIVGRGRFGEETTRIVASREWELSEEVGERDPMHEHLIALDRVNGVSIHGLVLASEPEHRLTGAIHCRRCEDVQIHDLTLQDFRWAGLHMEGSSRLKVFDCRIEDASTDKGRFHNGLIRTRWIKDSEIHHNHILSNIGGGYGYKGGGHVGVRIHHNYVDVSGGFAIESAHENEFGVEIDHNYLTRCISIPKSGQGADPNSRGYQYSFWIHDNYLTDSYTVEGPRNHLRLSHNYIHVERPNGRIYTHHGGINHGPVWIHHNVIENVDRALVWMNNGLAENIYIYNNTIFCADAGRRTGAILGAYSGERLGNWVFKNNVVIAAWSQSRKLFPDQRGVPEKINATHNLCINVTGVPEGNYADVDPGLRREGDKPWPFYLPAGEGSPVVDRGEDVGLPFKGKAPDIGAFELGEERPLMEIPREGK